MGLVASHYCISNVLSLFEQRRLEINNLSFGQFNVVLLRSPTTFVLLNFNFCFFNCTFGAIVSIGNGQMMIHLVNTHCMY